MSEPHGVGFFVAEHVLEDTPPSHPLPPQPVSPLWNSAKEVVPLFPSDFQYYASPQVTKGNNSPTTSYTSGTWNVNGGNHGGGNGGNNAWSVNTRPSSYSNPNIMSSEAPFGAQIGRVSSFSNIGGNNSLSLFSHSRYSSPLQGNSFPGPQLNNNRAATGQLHSSSSVPSKLSYLQTTMSVTSKTGSELGTKTSSFASSNASSSFTPLNSYIRPDNRSTDIPISNSRSFSVSENLLSVSDLDVVSKPIHKISSVPSLNMTFVKCNNSSQGCVWRGPTDKQTIHYNSECLYTSVTCRFGKVGCPFKAARHELPIHDATCMSRHLELCESKIDELTSYVSTLEKTRRKVDIVNLTPALENSTDISDDELIHLLARILYDQGKASVGKLGSLLHSYTNNHNLSALCKEKYGGLKKFLETQSQIFTIGQDHPFNPTVWISSNLPEPWLTSFQNLAKEFHGTASTVSDKLLTEESTV